MIEKNCRTTSKTCGGIAEINIAHLTTKIEMKERKGRVEDALHATQFAIRRHSTSGGVALLRARHVLHDLKDQVTGDEITGVNIVYRAQKLLSVKLLSTQG